MAGAGTSDVNLNGNGEDEINVKRLGEQQKELLRYFYGIRDEVRMQVDVIEDLYGEVTDSRKASVCRSISKLKDHGLIYKQHTLYYPNMDAWCRARPRFGISELGEAFVENDGRFPEIEPIPEDERAEADEDPANVSPTPEVDEYTEALAESFPIDVRRASALTEAGFRTAADVHQASIPELTDVDGIGNEAALRMKAIMVDVTLAERGEESKAVLDLKIDELAELANVDPGYVPGLLSETIEGLGLR